MKPDEDPLAFLLHLNLACTEKESKGAPITPPGLPACIENRGDLITADCIQAMTL
jgi:hypothetical protein